MGRRRKRIDLQHHDLPTKANRILNIVLVALILILVRIWHLSVVQHEAKIEESHKPQKKMVIEPAIRGTIRDRFNLPLAINKINYQAAILYSQIREIPAYQWVIDGEGKRVRRPKRREFIHQVAMLLADELNLESDKVEDLIHSKAAFYPQVPFIIKDDLTEKEYYRLKMLEKDWPGVQARHSPKRYYPQGKVGADIIGYMGVISKNEYESILQEIRELESYLNHYDKLREEEFPRGLKSIAEVKARLKDLVERSYTLHDHIGKTGIEGRYEEDLRGYCGKKSFYSDSKGNFLREFPGARPPLSGKRLLLTISSELQSYAEQILTQNEQIRVVRKTALGGEKHTVIAYKQPWIKGGAIIAMDPNNGDILALASYPRIDPNDFIVSGDPDVKKIKQSHIQRWFENDSFLADLWNQKQLLHRERYNDELHQFYDEQKFLTWKTYLDFLLPLDSSLRKAMDGVFTIHQAIEVQHMVEELLLLSGHENIYELFNELYPSPVHIPFTVKNRREREGDSIPDSVKIEIQIIQKRLNPYLTLIPQNYDKVLLVDLCRLAVNNTLFTDELLNQVTYHSLTLYHNASGSLVTIKQLVKEMVKDHFHVIDFKKWRESEEKLFLKQKRDEEKLSKSYPKPYLDYLNKKEEELFQVFWEANQWDFILAFLKGKLNSNSDFQEYFEPLLKLHKEIEAGAHQSIEWRRHYKILQESIKDLSMDLSVQYLKSMRSFSELDRALLGRYRGLRNSLNPKERDLAVAFYPIYGWSYGRSHAYRQSTTQGSIFKIVVAYEALIQQLKRLNIESGSFRELNPLILIEQSHHKGNTFCIGYSESGVSIPQSYKGGRLPRSLAHRNPGKLDLVKALGVSSNPYFSLLAGDYLEDPEDLIRAAKEFSYGSRTGVDLPGEIPGALPKDVTSNRTGLYALAIGQHSLVATPLQTAVMLSAVANGGKIVKPNIIYLKAGRQPLRGDNKIVCLPSFAFKQYLNRVGIDFPLFSLLNSRDPKNGIHRIAPEIRRQINMPTCVRNILLQGLRVSSNKSHSDNNSRLANLYRQHPEAMKTFTELKDQILGKTSTSESVEQIDLDLKEGINMYTHVWFSGIAFKPQPFLYKDEYGKPELVVVVYLRYGGYGKEAAPLAAQMVKRWRELKELHGEE
jgi:cell division protein FtsI/penicillin-binding protein 2